MEDVSWDLYQRMLDEIGDGNTRLTFDNGRLEIMSPSRFHERVKTVLGRLIETYGDALEIVVEGAGSTTFKRKDLLKGLEPDECYYIAHAEEIEGRDDLDLTIDPPPDLVIEIDLSHPGVARQPIYAAMGVPEIWKYDGSKVIPLHLNDGQYIAAEQSLAFPELPMKVVNEIVQLALTKTQSAAMASFRKWLTK
jgi:Uma2 family endonuclease